jgi:hypothetical protein
MTDKNAPLKKLQEDAYPFHLCLLELIDNLNTPKMTPKPGSIDTRPSFGKSGCFEEADLMDELLSVPPTTYTHIQPVPPVSHNNQCSYN